MFYSNLHWITAKLYYATLILKIKVRLRSIDCKCHRVGCIAYVIALTYIEHTHTHTDRLDTVSKNQCFVSNWNSKGNDAGVRSNDELSSSHSSIHEPQFIKLRVLILSLASSRLISEKQSGFEYLKLAAVRTNFYYVAPRIFRRHPIPIRK